MKQINRKQTIEEFNEALRDGLEHGVILSDSQKDLPLITELYLNLHSYFKFFVECLKQKSHQKQ